MMPRFTIEQVRQTLQIHPPTATACVLALENLGIHSEKIGLKKNRICSHRTHEE